jgi:hypothetical protein
VNTGMPRGVGTPNLRNTSLPWYSWMFMDEPPGRGDAGLGLLETAFYQPRLSSP